MASFHGVVDAMKYLMVHDKHDTYAIFNDDGVEFAALELLTKRYLEGFWYYDEDAKKAKKIINAANADAALAFLLERKNHEYEYVEVKYG